MKPDLKPKPGEPVWDWLHRNLEVFCIELATMAMDREGIDPKIRLECLKELISRPLPKKSVCQISPVLSEVDLMSDEDFKQYLLEQLRILDESKDTQGKDSRG